MKLRLDIAAAVASCVASTVNALLVTDGSPCASKCGNVLDSDSPSDMSCSASEYEGSAGVVFERCVNCELTSTYADGSETDLQWMLYNLRYATSFCLFGYPNHTDWDDNPCRTRTACGPLEDAIKLNSLATNVTAYEYCSSWDAGQVSDCNACLENGEQFYGLRNFVTILDAACLQLPETGGVVSIEGDPFSLTQVNITNSTEIGDVSDYEAGSFSIGAKVGVAVAGVLVLLATIGICIVWNGKRRRRAFLRKLEKEHGPGAWPNYHPGGADMFETPISQKPFAGWTDSPLTPSEKQFPKYFSPYSSQYNSPTSAVDAQPQYQWPDKAQAQQMTIGLALGGASDNRNSSPREAGSSSKGKEREEYEMTDVDSRGNEYMPKVPDAPVLHHPGYGRGNPHRLDNDMYQ
ncbi:hypothetical protein MKZ38_007053 [Zalerion maritima]|uniref:Lpxtg-domain-containing protein n=1 Tax=Zalerion maritima TaxID=339359 RepID=A0AAD5WUC6_9PEZI|nr:hypothetical protein MKZ38_007053 [Zalerion maritima]